MSLRHTLVVAVVALSTVACAKEEPPPKGAAPGPEDPKATDAREHCVAFVASLCASAAPCCESTTGAISVEACMLNMRMGYCEPAAQLVNEGIATYHAESEEACLAAWARAHATCVADWDELLAIRRDVWAACKVVLGTYEAGRGCSISSECAQPEGPSVTHCLPHPMTHTLVCQVLELLGEGADCPFPSGEVSVCDVGLYCTTTDLGVSGVCAPIVPEGEPCDTSVAQNSECGLGNYCGRDDALCHHAVNFGGPACGQDAECASLVCQRGSGNCLDVPPTAADLCIKGT